MPRAQRSNPKTKHHAIELRKDLTPLNEDSGRGYETVNLESLLERQHAIGNYVTDFCSPKAKLIIELDGSQHLEQEEYDLERMNFLESQGYKVLHFWNNQVLNEIDAVMITILSELELRKEA